MFHSRSYSLSEKERGKYRTLEKVTFRNDITDDAHSPLNQFNRQRPGSVPARYRKPTQRSASAPGTLLAPPSPNIDAKSWSKDETEDGVIFSATLKKVRYRSSVSPSTGNDVQGLFWQTIKIRVLKAGTLVKLVEHLTPGSTDVSDEDPSFLLCFLCTYKAFTSTEQILDLLLERYRVTKHLFANGEVSETVANNIFSCVCRVLSIWLDQYPTDFEEPEQYPSLHKIINFAKNEVTIDSGVNLLRKSEDLLDKFTVRPFECDAPYRFKCCNCDAPVGCNCEISGSPTVKVNGQNSFDELEITSFSTSAVAEQLTLVDADLFRRVIPRHCLARFWSKRDRLTGANAPSTIKATIDQFNAIVRAVTTTILDAVGTKTKLKDAQARSKVIATWIDIAKDCRSLKNFSSLKAIIAGLQSTPIHRLTKTWPLLSKETISVYEELSEICSGDLNSKTSRDILMQEGTAKYAPIDARSSRKSLKKRESWIREGIVQGTIPYLGTFLNDLTMIDSAHPNRLENDYINFAKRRKEFEVIVQIKLLQEAAKNYKFSKEPIFLTWFQKIKPHSDKDSFKTSCELEPERAVTPQVERRDAYMRKHSSVPDLSCNVFDEEDGKILRKLSSMLSGKVSKALGDSPTQKQNTMELLSPDSRKSFQDDQREIAKIMVEGSHEHVYKSVLVSAMDKTRDVIFKGLEKYDIQEKPEDYRLFQVVPGSKDLHLPHNTNVFYAVNKNVELKFILKRQRKESLNKR